MDVEKAISLLKQIKSILLNSNSLMEDAHEPITQSFNMAIRSLEAWEKVKKDIYRYKADCVISAMDYDNCKQCNTIIFNSIFNIIDKYLQEVESEKNT